MLRRRLSTGPQTTERDEILEKIDQYLAGQVPVGEVVLWATLAMSNDPGRKDMGLEDYIIADALGALMMLSESEPEEYRTTGDELLKARFYLSGEEPFPVSRFPKRH